MTKHSRSMQK